MNKKTGDSLQKSSSEDAGVRTPEFMDICRYAFELSPVGMVAVEGATHIVRYVNPAFSALSGKAREEIVGYSFRDVVPEGLTNRCEELLDRVYRCKETETLTDQKHESSAFGVYWSYTAWPMLDPAEDALGLMIQVTDTSASRHTSQQSALMNEALMIHGLKQEELADALAMREQTVKMNEALTVSLMEQNELTTALNNQLQRAVQETHHRVKNNLQIVAALAEIQMVDGSEVVPVAALERIAIHVRSLASLHDVLTLQVRENASGDTVDSAVALVKLVSLLQTSVGARRILYQIASIPLTIQKSASLSLLVSELVSNAAKHGAGDIQVTLEQTDETASLTVSDTGKGFPPDFDPAAGVSTGMELILSLVRHDLGGEITFANAPDGGASITAVFPVG